MQNLIDRLNVAAGVLEQLSDAGGISLEHMAIVVAATQELSAVANELASLNQEHTRQTDELRGLRQDIEEINLAVRHHRRQYKIYDDEVSNRGDDVGFLLTEMGSRMAAATDDAAALRRALEGIRDVARKAEYDSPDMPEFHRNRDLLGSVAHRASEGLKEHQSGAALRKDIRQLEAMIDKFEEGVQQTGGWHYSDRTLAARVQHCVDHYTRMAAEAVSESHSFKDSLIAWLRGIAINAQAASWASTHHEKDARLRGLIEVIETAISKINDVRFTDRLTTWNHVTDAWMKSDFPTREMRRRILELEAENQRLKKTVEESKPAPLPKRDSAGHTYEEAQMETNE